MLRFLQLRKIYILIIIILNIFTSTDMAASLTECTEQDENNLLQDRWPKDKLENDTDTMLLFLSYRNHDQQRDSLEIILFSQYKNRWLPKIEEQKDNHLHFIY